MNYRSSTGAAAIDCGTSRLLLIPEFISYSVPNRTHSNPDAVSAYSLVWYTLFLSVALATQCFRIATKSHIRLYRIDSD
jgi:hypothetical protein